MLRDYSLYAPSTQARLLELQRKVLDDTITEPEMAEAVSLMREGRIAAAAVKKPAARRISKKKQAMASPARSASEIMSALLGPK